jgi:hypothetical protein
MDTTEPLDVYTTKDPAEAEMLKNPLERDGAKCELDGEVQANLEGILDNKVLLRAWDVERARQVLAAHTHHHVQPKKDRRQ